MWGQFSKQLWPSDIREKPSQTCANFCLYMLLFNKIYLIQRNSSYFTEKWHFWYTIFKTINYPLQSLMCWRTRDQISLLCDVDTIGHVVKYCQTCIRDSTIVFAMHNILRCRDPGQGVPSANKVHTGLKSAWILTGSWKRSWKQKLALRPIWCTWICLKVGHLPWKVLEFWLDQKKETRSDSSWYVLPDIHSS